VRSTARGRVFKRGRTWHMEVVDSEDKVVISDNTGRWWPMMEQCLEYTDVIQKVENMGHRLRNSYSEIVDMADVDG
jgi:hypothetical protein